MMRVVWANLMTYMKENMPEIDGPAGGTNPGVLWEEPLKNNTCAITAFTGSATAAAKFDLRPAEVYLESNSE